MGRKRSRKGQHLLLLVAVLTTLSLGACVTAREREARDALSVARQAFVQEDFEPAITEYMKVVSVSDSAPPADEALYNLGVIYAHYRNQKRDLIKSLDYFKRLIDDFPQSDRAADAKVMVRILVSLEDARWKEGFIKQQLDEAMAKLSDTNAKLAEVKEKARKEPCYSIHERLFRTQRLLTQADYDRAIDENTRMLNRSENKPPADEALFALGLLYAHQANNKKDLNRSLGYFRRLTRDFPQSPLLEEAKILANLLDTIEKAKQVDIEMEEARKKLTK